MTTDLVKVESKELPPLKELMREFSPYQRHYLSLRLVGFPAKDAREAIHARASTLEKWDYDEKYHDIECLVLANREQYEPEALLIWSSAISWKARILLEKLMDIGLYQTDCPPMSIDKGLLKTASLAAQIILRMTSKSDQIPDESYDELILKRHRKISDKTP